MKANNVLELIGNTPCVKITKIFGSRANVWIKLESKNPAGSIKDRIALSMIEAAEAKGLLKEGDSIVEPTSGNTGIGLAMVAAVKGYKLILVMPESMSPERRRILRAFGAELLLTPKEKGMAGAIELAKEIMVSKNAWMPMQFDNEANPEIHARATAAEIFEDFGNDLDYLITGVGTGGHISGISRVLKPKNPRLKSYAVEPEESAVISGKQGGPHFIQGIGAGFIPKNLDVSLLDGVICISKEEAFEYTRKAAKMEGLFVGISTGASLAAIAKMMQEIGNKTTLTLAYDSGEKYLSVENLFDSVIQL